MRFHAEVGGRTIIVHPSGSPTSPDVPLYTRENVGAATEQAHRSISELVPVAEETGVRMALENLVGKMGFPARPLETMQELRSFMADLPAEYVGICHDIGHTRLRKLDVAEETRIASERLYALHIQDGSSDEDDHLPPGHGVIDFDSFGQALDDIGFDGAWTLEVLATNHPGTVEDVAIELTITGQVGCRGDGERSVGESGWTHETALSPFDRLRVNGLLSRTPLLWIPAFAGMTVGVLPVTSEAGL